ESRPRRPTADRGRTAPPEEHSQPAARLLAHGRVPRTGRVSAPALDRMSRARPGPDISRDPDPIGDARRQANRPPAAPRPGVIDSKGIGHPDWTLGRQNDLGDTPG